MSPYPADGAGDRAARGVNGYAGLQAPHQEPPGPLAALAALGRIAGNGPAWGSNGWVVAGSRTASAGRCSPTTPTWGSSSPRSGTRSACTAAATTRWASRSRACRLSKSATTRASPGGSPPLRRTCRISISKSSTTPVHPRRYQFQNAWRDLAIRRETIAVKGKPDLVLEVRETVHGPIINDAISELKGSLPAAIHWPALQGTHLVDALSALNRASDWKSFHGALAAWDTPSVNFVYADVDGHIGYQSTGGSPCAPRATRGWCRFPVGTAAPSGRASSPMRRCPSVSIRPRASSSPPTTRWWATTTRTSWPTTCADPYRAQRITDLLAAGHKFHPRGPCATSRPRRSACPRRPCAPTCWPCRRPASWRRRRSPRSAAGICATSRRRSGPSVYEVWYWYLIQDILTDELGRRSSRSTRRWA